MLGALNRLPRDAHGADLTRVREWALAGLYKHYRQTVLLSSFASGAAELGARVGLHGPGPPGKCQRSLVLHCLPPPLQPR